MGAGQDYAIASADRERPPQRSAKNDGEQARKQHEPPGLVATHQPAAGPAAYQAQDQDREGPRGQPVDAINPPLSARRARTLT